MKYDSMHREWREGYTIFTFGVIYKYDDLGEVWEDCEEIDIFATSSKEAKELAERCANDFLAPGWSRIIGMTPGGSAGLVRVMTGAI